MEFVVMWKEGCCCHVKGRVKLYSNLYSALSKDPRESNTFFKEYTQQKLKKQLMLCVGWNGSQNPLFCPIPSNRKKPPRHERHKAPGKYLWPTNLDKGLPSLPNQNEKAECICFLNLYRCCQMISLMAWCFWNRKFPSYVKSKLSLPYRVQHRTLQLWLESSGIKE